MEFNTDWVNRVVIEPDETRPWEMAEIAPFLPIANSIAGHVRQFALTEPQLSALELQRAQQLSAVELQSAQHSYTQELQKAQQSYGREL